MLNKTYDAENRVASLGRHFPRILQQSVSMTSSRKLLQTGSSTADQALQFVAALRNSLPRFDMFFQPVSSTFNPYDINYLFVCCVGERSDESVGGCLGCAWSYNWRYLLSHWSVVSVWQTLLQLLW